MPRQRPARRRSFSSLVPYAYLEQPNLARNKDGSCLAIWEVQGADLESADPSEHEARSARFNHAIHGYGDGWELSSQVVRSEARAEELANGFDEPTGRLLDEERRRSYDTPDRHYRSGVYFMLTHRADGVRTGSGFSLRDLRSEDARRRDERLVQRFQDECREIEDQLTSVFEVERLEGGELLTVLRTCITGLHHPMRVPNPAMYLDHHLTPEPLRVGLTPMIGPRHLRVISMTDLPAESSPAMLDALTRLTFSYRWTCRFLPLDPSTAEVRIRGVRRTWLQKRKGALGLMREATGEDPGIEDGNADHMAADATSALALASDGTVRFGYFTSTIVLFDEDAERVEEAASELLKAVRNLGFSARLEDVNAVEAYLGSLPSNGYRNVRKTLLHTLNLADLMPLTAIWTGRRRGDGGGIEGMPNPQQSPLFVANTSGATPFFFYPTEGDVGNAMIQGPTGSGKSLMAVAYAIWFLRYPRSKVFYFDLGLSSFVAANAVGAAFHELTAGEDAAYGFAPLAFIDEPQELLRAQSFLELLLVLQGVKPSSASRREIHQALVRLATSSTRTLSALNPQSRELQDAFAFYCVGGGQGGLLDADRDTIQQGRFVVYEYQDLLDRGDMVSLPILDHLFAGIDRELDGRPILIVVDEAWKTLLHPAFQARIIAWLKTLRKKNASLLFVTQDLSDLFGSGRAETMLSATPTRILLPNPAAGEPVNAEHYRQIGLNEQQIQLLATAAPKREYYVVSPSGRRMIDLDLTSVELAFLGRSTPEDIRRARELIGRHGTSWPAHWLDELDLGEAAARWREMRRRDQSGEEDG